MPSPTMRALTDTALVRALAKRGVTRRQIADATGYDPRTVSRWLAGAGYRPAVRAVLEGLLAEAEHR